MDKASKIIEAEKIAEDPDWIKAQRTREMGRLEGILRNPEATDADRTIAEDQLAFWKGLNPVSTVTIQQNGRRETEIFFCNECKRLFEHGSLLRINRIECCPNCRTEGKLERALCANETNGRQCNQPATHITINASETDAYCQKH